jgi:hypothetical protein
MTDDLIRPVRGAFPGPAIEPNSGIRDQLALLGKVGVRYGGLGVAPSLLDNLVAYYKLDETSGPRIDSAGSNNLTDNGNVGSTMGKIGNAALFDGTNKSLSVNTPNLYNNISFSTWFYVGQFLSGFRSIFTQFSSFLNELGVWWLNGDIGIYDDIDDAGTFLYQTPVLLNTWYHVVCTINGSNGNELQLWLNGSLSGSGLSPTSSFSSIGGEFVIGARTSDDNSLPLGGSVDELGIWSRVLTPEEIAILYNGGSGITFPF